MGLGLVAGVCLAGGFLAAVVGGFGWFEANVGSRPIALFMTAPGMLVWLTGGAILAFDSVLRQAFEPALTAGGVLTLAFAPSVIGFCVALRKAP